MKASRILCVCAAVALPQLSMAQQAPNSQSLGMVLAILHFCTAVDPRDAAAFRAQERSLLAGVSVSALASVKGSNNYKQSFNLITGMLAQLPKADAAQTCAADAHP